MLQIEDRSVVAKPVYNTSEFLEMVILFLNNDFCTFLNFFNTFLVF